MNYQTFREIAQHSKREKMASDVLYRYEREFSTYVAWLIHHSFPFISGNHVSSSSILVLFLVFVSSVLYESSAYMDRTWLFIVQLLLLYSLTLLDKVDGSLARAKENTTKMGQYLDRAVHFLFPLIFYFTVGHFFFHLGGPIELFYITLLLGFLTQKQIFFSEAKLTIREKIRTGRLTPSASTMQKPQKKKKRPFLLIRIIDYTTFMLYAWTLFLYVGLAVLSFYSFEFSYNIYFAHILLSLLVVCYRTFFSYPKNKL